MASSVSFSLVRHCCSASPINSVDVQPGSLRFATGSEDASVKIWLMAPLYEARLEAQRCGTAPLCSGVAHDGAIAVVRWSDDGRQLASGGQDGVIVIWRQRAGVPPAAAPSSLVGTAIPATELWPPAYYLKGAPLPGADGKPYRPEVLDVAWHPRGAHLVSCSNESRVLVWRIPAAAAAAGGAPAAAARTITAPVLAISEHESIVCAVAWDPFGGLLATLGGDKRLLLWRAAGFDEDEVPDDAAAEDRAAARDGASGRRRGPRDGRGALIHRKSFGGGPAPPASQHSLAAVSLVGELTAPFSGWPGACPARHIGWAPDGAVLAAGGAVLLDGGEGRGAAGGGFCAALLSRASLLGAGRGRGGGRRRRRSDEDGGDDGVAVVAAPTAQLVGARRHVTSARFCPSLLMLSPTAGTAGGAGGAEDSEGGEEVTASARRVTRRAARGEDDAALAAAGAAAAAAAVGVAATHLLALGAADGSFSVWAPPPARQHAAGDADAAPAAAAAAAAAVAAPAAAAAAAADCGRPLITVVHAFTGPVTDLAWGWAAPLPAPADASKGTGAAAVPAPTAGAAPILLVASSDGTLVALVFGGGGTAAEGGVTPAAATGDAALAAACGTYGARTRDVAAAAELLRVEARGGGGDDDDDASSTRSGNSESASRRKKLRRGSSSATRRRHGSGGGTSRRGSAPPAPALLLPWLQQPQQPPAAPTTPSALAECLVPLPKDLARWFVRGAARAWGGSGRRGGAAAPELLRARGDAAAVVSAVPEAAVYNWLREGGGGGEGVRQAAAAGGRVRGSGAKRSRATGGSASAAGSSSGVSVPTALLAAVLAAAGVQPSPLPLPPSNATPTLTLPVAQVEGRKGGKRRIQPVLQPPDGGDIGAEEWSALRRAQVGALLQRSAADGGELLLPAAGGGEKEPPSPSPPAGEPAALPTLHASARVEVGDAAAAMAATTAAVAAAAAAAADSSVVILDDDDADDVHPGAAAAAAAVASPSSGAGAMPPPLPSAADGKITAPAPPPASPAPGPHERLAPFSNPPSGTPTENLSGGAARDEVGEGEATGGAARRHSAVSPPHPQLQRTPRSPLGLADEAEHAGDHNARPAAASGSPHATAALGAPLGDARGSGGGDGDGGAAPVAAPQPRRSNFASAHMAAMILALQTNGAATQLQLQLQLQPQQQPQLELDPAAPGAAGAAAPAAASAVLASAAGATAVRHGALAAARDALRPFEAARLAAAAAAAAYQQRLAALLAVDPAALRVASWLTPRDRAALRDEAAAAERRAKRDMKADGKALAPPAPATVDWTAQLAPMLVAALLGAAGGGAWPRIGGWGGPFAPDDQQHPRPYRVRYSAEQQQHHWGRQPTPPGPDTEVGWADEAEEEEHEGEGMQLQPYRRPPPAVPAGPGCTPLTGAGLASPGLSGATPHPDREAAAARDASRPLPLAYPLPLPPTLPARITLPLPPRPDGGSDATAGAGIRAATVHASAGGLCTSADPFDAAVAPPGDAFVTTAAAAVGAGGLDAAAPSSPLVGLGAPAPPRVLPRHVIECVRDWQTQWQVTPPARVTVLALAVAATVASRPPAPAEAMGADPAPPLPRRRSQRLLLAGCADGSVAAYDADARGAPAMRALVAGAGPVRHLVWAPPPTLPAPLGMQDGGAAGTAPSSEPAVVGRLVAVTCDGRLRVWRLVAVALQPSLLPADGPPAPDGAFPPLPLLSAHCERELHIGELLESAALTLHCASVTVTRVALREGDGALVVTVADVAGGGGQQRALLEYVFDAEAAAWTRATAA